MRLILFLSLLFIQGCASHFQDKIGEEFKSIQPDFSNYENGNNATEGAVYDGMVGFLHLTEEQTEWEIL